MKRDIELVRKILLEIESKDEPDGWIFPELEGYSEEEVNYHIKIMAEAGLIEARDLSTMNTFEWAAINLTWEGHEFLDASRNDTIWKKSKSIIKDKLGSVSFEVLKSLLIKTTAAHLGL